MNFELSPCSGATASAFSCDALLVCLTDAFKPGRDTLSALIAKLTKAGDLPAKSGQLLDLYRPAGWACKRLVIVNAGAGAPTEIGKAVSAATALVKSGEPKHLGVYFAHAPNAAQLRAALTAVADTSYVFTTTKSKAEERSIKKMDLLVADPATWQADFERWRAAVQGIELAKHWGNLPANHATPSKLAQAAELLAKQPRIKCKIHGPKEVAKLGMGAFLAVAQGSDEPLRFIELSYNGAGKGAAPVVLVGKGITFDSGGISIKPAAEMDEMKFDMCGAASVLGVFHALAQLQPAVHVIGLIPACENLPGGRAVKPGDVVTSMSGQTIEILNTDAEGRLVLCDALTYAERFKPSAVIDIATLTGACVIALGAVRSGLFSPDAALSAALAAAGDEAQDLCWPMPMDDAYAEGLKTNFADVANVAGRPGGAITAAKFLHRFTSKYRWAHLDIAASAWNSGKAKGATGRPVGLLLEYVVSLALVAQAN